MKSNNSIGCLYLILSVIPFYFLAHFSLIWLGLSVWKLGLLLALAIFYNNLSDLGWNELFKSSESGDTVSEKRT